MRPLRQWDLCPWACCRCLSMTYLGQENDFVKSLYSLIRLEVHFRHSLGILSACNAFFEFLCGIFASQKFHTLRSCLGRTSFNCPIFSKTCSFLFTLYACWGNYVDIWPRINQFYRYQPLECFSALLCFRLVMKWLLNL